LHESQKRLNTLVGLSGGDSDETKRLRLRKSKFGLGDRRTIKQYTEFSGIDVANRILLGDDKKRCGNLQWVPFLEHPNGADYIPRFHDTTLDSIGDFDETDIRFAKAGDKQENVEARADDDGPGEVRNIARQQYKENDNEKSNAANANHFQPGLTPKKMTPKRLGHQISQERHHAGLHKLPLMVQLSVIVLVLGVAFSIFIQKGTGVGRRKFLARRKRDV